MARAGFHRVGIVLTGHLSRESGLDPLTSQWRQELERDLAQTCGRPRGSSPSGMVELDHAPKPKWKIRIDRPVLRSSRSEGGHSTRHGPLEIRHGRSRVRGSLQASARRSRSVAYRGRRLEGLAPGVQSSSTAQLSWTSTTGTGGYPAGACSTAKPVLGSRLNTGSGPIGGSGSDLAHSQRFCFGGPSEN